MRNSLLKSLILGTTFALTCGITALATSVGGGTINATNVNFRSEASSDSAIIAKFDYSSPLIVISHDNSEWTQVWSGGTIGYVSAQYLDFSDSLDFSVGTGTITGTDVNFRAAASTDSEVYTKVHTGDTVDVLGVSFAWYKVSYDGQVGYINSDYVNLTGDGSTAVSSPTIVSTAYKYMGTPYVWAGTSPSGFDCSGFVYYVFNENGITTNRTAALLYQNGVAVDRSDLQAGDIICFYNGSYSYIGHVGIYIGDNQFIHASSADGKVTIDSLESSYYNSHYYGARRIA